MDPVLLELVCRCNCYSADLSERNRRHRIWNSQLVISLLSGVNRLIGEQAELLAVGLAYGLKLNRDVVRLERGMQTEAGSTSAGS